MDGCIKSRIVCGLCLAVGACCLAPDREEWRFALNTPAPPSIALAGHKFYQTIGGKEYYIFDEEGSFYKTLLQILGIKPKHDCGEFSKISGTRIYDCYTTELCSKLVPCDENVSNPLVITSMQPSTCYKEEQYTKEVYTSTNSQAIITTPVQILHAMLRNNVETAALWKQCGDDRSCEMIFDYVERQRLYVGAKKTLEAFGLADKTLLVPQQKDLSEVEQLEGLKSAVRDIRDSAVPDGAFDAVCERFLEMVNFDSADSKDGAVELSKCTRGYFTQLCNYYLESTADESAIQWMDDHTCCNWIVEGGRSFTVLGKFYHLNRLWILLAGREFCKITSELNIKISHHNLLTLDFALEKMHDMFASSQDRSLTKEELAVYERLSYLITQWGSKGPSNLRAELKIFIENRCSCVSPGCETSFNTYSEHIASLVCAAYKATEPASDAREQRIYGHRDAIEFLSKPEDEATLMPKVVVNLLDYTCASFHKFGGERATTIPTEPKPKADDGASATTIPTEPNPNTDDAANAAA